MSGNEAADYSKRDAALLLFGAVATVWAVLVLWQWGMTAAESGFRSPPLIRVGETGPLRQLPEDPGGEKVPNANREFQLAITAPDPASVWRNSRVIEQAGFSPSPGSVPDGGSPPRTAAALPTTGSETDEAAQSAAAGSLDQGALISPPPEDSALIQPLPVQDAAQSGGGDSAVQDVIPDAFRQPPERRPGA